MFPSTALISDCCHALIVMDGSDYQCCMCTKHCKPDGTLADLQAPKVEHNRLKGIVVDVAKRWTKAAIEGAHAQIAADNELRDAVTALESFEANQK